MTLPNPPQVPTLAELLDAAEIEQMAHRLGRRGMFGHHVTLPLDEPTFNDWWESIIATRNRRGEVLLVVQRPDRRVLLHTKADYPPGAHRLLTGGIHYAEPVLDAAMRELAEETGLAGRIDRFLGFVAYQLEHGARRVPFVSYAVLVQVDDTPPAPQDPEEDILEYRYVPPAQLGDIAGRLRSLPANWDSWGRFRAVGHDLVAEALNR